MRTLNDREKRTVRYGAIGVAIYLALFGGVRMLKFLNQRRADYAQAVTETSLLRSGVRSDTDKAALVKKMMDDFQIDPATLSTNSVVAGASAAIQKAIMGSGMGLTSIRESPGRSSHKEIATIQFQSAGPVPGMVSLIHRLPLLGYPIVIDSVQITADPMQPGVVKLMATVFVLDYQEWINEWKKREASHA
jgi:hypothetical protein